MKKTIKTAVVSSNGMDAVVTNVRSLRQTVGLQTIGLSKLQLIILAGMLILLTACDNGTGGRRQLGGGGAGSGNNNVAVTGVALNNTTLALTVEGADTLTVDITPSNATNTNVTWSTSNASVATVDNGTVTAVAVGSATITVTTASGNKTAACTVTVTAAGGAPVAVTGVTLNKTTLALTVLEHETLHQTVAPENATNKAVTWSSSNASVATVNDGLVTAVAVGTATITVTTVDGSITASCEVTVSAPIAVTGVTLNKNSLTLPIGEYETLHETVAPSNAANKAVTWSTNNPSRATVNNNGLITPVAVGTVTITVTTVDGSITATCTVTVIAHNHNNWGWASYTTGSGLRQCQTAGCTVTAGVGDTGPAGGKIIHAAASGFTVQGYTGSFAEYTAHYLEAAPVNQSTSLKWCSHSFPSYCNVTGAMGIAIGTGKANTAAIIAAHSGDTAANNAAKACDEYSNNGFSDWFLPSREELLAMYNARTHLGISGPGATYWSSSQSSNEQARYVDFGLFADTNQFKENSSNVRAIRAF